MYSTVADILRVIMRTITIQSGEQANQVIDNALGMASYTLWYLVNHTMNTFLLSNKSIQIIHTRVD